MKKIFMLALAVATSGLIQAASKEVKAIKIVTKVPDVEVMLIYKKGDHRMASPRSKFPESGKLKRYFEWDSKTSGKHDLTAIQVFSGPSFEFDTVEQEITQETREKLLQGYYIEIRKAPKTVFLALINPKEEAARQAQNVSPSDDLKAAQERIAKLEQEIADCTEKLRVCNYELLYGEKAVDG